jgi:ABC-type glycerol-3-phosphate transport system substrate-binding protein
MSILRPLLIATLAALIAAAATGAGAQPGEAAITCTNPSSGTTWQIRIDYQKATVDQYPASITDAEISWHDASDGGNYTLDRKSGNLRVAVASSTGGYFLHHRCRLEN